MCPNTTIRINCSSFSEDSTLMAAGFAESYIRIWNLKKEKLKGLRSDISPHISDGKFFSIWWYSLRLHHSDL
jgi:WD40 repeat protein